MFFKSKLKKSQEEIDKKIQMHIAKSLEQQAIFEHEYHNAREFRKCEISKLDGEIAAKEKYIKALNDQFQMPKDIINQLLQILKDKNVKINNNNSDE